MDDKPLFQGMDELERVYAPQQLPPEEGENVRARLEEGGEGGPAFGEPPAPAPVANLGNAPSAAAAPPNIGHEEHGGAPGDPNTEARNPLDTEDDLHDRVR